MQKNLGQTPLQLAFDKAIGLHQTGNLIEAERYYREVLSLNPRHSDSIHYLGVIAHQTGKNDLAVALIGTAIEINDKDASYFANLALALSAMARFEEALVACDMAISRNPNVVRAHLSRGIALNALGRIDEAEAVFKRAVQIAPDFSNAHFHLGLVLRSLGQLEEAGEAFAAAIRITPAAAEAHFCLAAVLDDLGRHDESAAVYSTTTRLKPDHANAYCNLGSVLYKLSRHEEAVTACRAAIAIKPDFSGAYLNLGNALLELHRNEHAVEAYRQAIRIQPDFAEAYSLLGLALKIAGRLEESVAACTEAIRLKPDYAQGYFNLGIPLFDLGRLDDAIAACDAAIRLAPDFAEAHSNRAVALRESGKFRESLASGEKAIEINPDYPGAHFNESLVRLLMGNFPVGLKKYEWRHRGGAKELKARLYSQAQWTGQDVRGLTVLLYAEQGLGDSIQFCRYASLVKRRGARVVLEAPRHLLRLLEDLPGVDQFVAPDDTAPEFDFHCPLMSLPFACGTDIDTIPADIPYLHVQADVQNKWKTRLGMQGFKIGIAWQGSPTALAERGRSVPLACFEPLSKLPGVRLISLQKGHGIDQLSELPDGMRVETLGDDFDAGADAFIDTAALMMSLDLVITVDTAIGHLAGALGRPVWTVLQKVPHWVWMMDRTDSPWYPSVRLFRQNERGNWSELFQRVTRSLSEHIAESRRC